MHTPVMKFGWYSQAFHGVGVYFRLSVSNDLKVDAERDLKDIGASKIEVHALNKVSLVTLMLPCTKTDISLYY